MSIIRKKKMPLWILTLLAVCLLFAGCGGGGPAGKQEGQQQAGLQTGAEQPKAAEDDGVRSEAAPTEAERDLTETYISVPETDVAGAKTDSSVPETDNADTQTDDFVPETDSADTQTDDSVPETNRTDALPESDATDPETKAAGALDETGSYTSKDEVALYLHTFGHLPDNYITKKEAQALGWDNAKGNLADVAPGKSIGGDRFGNYEGLLPDAKGRRWTECDIDYESGYRNACRIIFSNDGLIYYTDDHYKSFEQLY